MIFEFDGLTSQDNRHCGTMFADEPPPPTHTLRTHVHELLVIRLQIVECIALFLTYCNEDHQDVPLESVEYCGSTHIPVIEK